MKVTVISDTHNQHLKLKNLPEADCIIHCGDFSNQPHQMEPFALWFSELPYKYKILIAGNHDCGLEDYETNNNFKQLCNELGITYLEDSGCEIEGIKFWGSPWSNQFGNWAFMGNDIELQIQAWDYIPDDTQVLITHGPAKGLGDEVYQTYGNEKDNHVGSASLRMTIERLPNLTHHFVGHIHEDFGVHQHPENKFITYNASSWEYYKSEMNEPWVFEIKPKV
jgi:Icc-related predicted phosphoesterase